ncbi:MAG TPA: tRNA preQ1(34) S-adenosylmethionine ribosyltransferase-isomerase QueA [Pseudothermotoga sp.]|nr:tRNA preQ1(34) S-adenosylmethionine ribosyltransferase-isomerase QueA [Pseudothermotoga sp.]HOK82732.1 tRNA preQ1(34) S-adenosylmethionine ribosyltransferase-isomerase QueA [Pseudothermotoga sp.]HPP70830.1 tRNA preQ1(34) S-adenosylmethionine ribosyltransferase-isomerase QueA [Pseudothermotoga sp.]
MKLSDFDYQLPEELIAQTPAEPRDTSRLMILRRDGKTIEHRIFRQIVDYLNPGDLLVINNTRVIPARLFAKKNDSTIEVFLLQRIDTFLWNCMVKPGKKVKPGDVLSFGDFTALCVDRTQEGTRILKFDATDDEILSIGNAPLPPYVHSKIPLDRYQTVYAKVNGAVAAPTAGLHFTHELMDRIRKQGVNIAEITLHVGIGTFRPVKTEDITQHRIHSEIYNIPTRTLNLIEDTKSSGGRVIAVGTTVVRTLEQYALNGRTEGETTLFIYPPYDFKIVDVLLTNFHLPKSTLLMLVAAFAGYEFTMHAYQEAIRQRYRFYSFGDAMLIL